MKRLNKYYVLQGHWNTPFTDAGKQPFHITETETETIQTMTVTKNMPYIYVNKLRSQVNNC